MNENNGEDTTGINQQNIHTSQVPETAAVPENEVPEATAPETPRAPQPVASQSWQSSTPPPPPAPTPAYGAHRYGAPDASQSQVSSQNQASPQNPTERIPTYGASAAAGAPAPTAAIPTSANPTEPIPSPSGATHAATGHAGPGYPTSNAYPHALPPAVTAPPKERKKVGMGLFAGSVLAAALVGGLVAGGSMFLVDQQSNGSATGASQQSAPLVVNNTSDVNAVTAAAAKAMPSVVTISATSGSSGGTGSGIILDAEGHILTNTHVVTLDGAAAHATIEVQTSDNKVYAGTIVGTDPLSDLAIVKIDAPNLVPATLGESGKINVGDTVIAIGSPLGLNGTVTDGIVSTLNRTIQVASSAVPEETSDEAQTPDDSGNGFRFSPPGGGTDTTAAQGTVNLNVIQTDAAINPGNSGGALVNSNGEIIGVNVAIASTGSSSDASSQSGNIGVGFSVPMDQAKRVAEEIIKNGSASHGQLGVSVSGTSSSGSDSAFSTGATVGEVTSGSAADKAGLKKGDVITKLGNRTISDPAELTAAVREQAGGATVAVNFTRSGKEQSADVTLDTMK
ncbi:S1C family serine protease [Arthrobacter sp. TWP1-1]|uniref:S1C family serine protease n=1 Tax=Arthrobacter sp. TWP1-1 TaxID=2804568 RepID=UPI003CEC6968